MSRKSVTRIIDGLELRCTQFESMVALGLLPRVSAFAAFTIKRAAEKGLGNESLVELLPVVFDVAVGLTAEEIQSLARDLLPATEAKLGGDWILLNSDKAVNLALENLPTLFKAILFSVEVNFLSFFDAAQPAKERSGGAAEASPDA